MFTLNVDGNIGELAGRATDQFYAQDDDQDDRSAFGLFRRFLEEAARAAPDAGPFAVTAHFETGEGGTVYNFGLRSLTADELEARRNDAVSPAELAGDEPEQEG